MIIPHPEDAGEENYGSIVTGREGFVDLDDELWSLEPQSHSQLKHIHKACKEPLNKDKCRTFGVQQWNLSSYYVATLEGKSDGKELCSEDQLLLDQLQGVGKGPCNSNSPACKRIDGKVR